MLVETTALESDAAIDAGTVRWTVTLAASLGWFFDAFVITIYALTVPLIAAEFGIETTVLSGAVGSIFLVGYTIGTIGFGMSGDRFGRRVMLGVSVIGYGLVTAATAAVSSVAGLAAMRFLTGVGGGGELAVGSPYVTEVWDRKRRGFGVGLMFAFYPLGYLFSILVFRLVAPTWSWRAVYLFSLVPALAIVILRLRLDKSPRFVSVMNELQRTNSRRVGLFEAVRNSSFRRRVLIVFLIFTSLAYAFNSMAFYIPAYVVRYYGLSPTSGATIVPALFEFGGLAGALIGGFLGDVLGRRKPAMVVAAVGMVIMYLWWGFDWPLAVFCLFAAAGGFIISFEWTLGVVYVNELFPTEIRATGFGWSAGLGRIVSIAAPLVTQALSVRFGVAEAIQISAVIWASLIVGYALSSETRGSDIADRFEYSTSSS